VIARDSTASASTSRSDGVVALLSKLGWVLRGNGVVGLSLVGLGSVGVCSLGGLHGTTVNIVSVGHYLDLVVVELGHLLGNDGGSSLSQMGLSKDDV
jgi:hypothetical protein